MCRDGWGGLTTIDPKRLELKTRTTCHASDHGQKGPWSDAILVPIHHGARTFNAAGPFLRARQLD
jgi:hypothetical protein